MSDILKRRQMNAQKVARYRERQNEEGGNVRLNTYINSHAKLALDRLSKHYAVTKKALLEKVLTEHEQELTKDYDEKQWSEHYD